MNSQRFFIQTLSVFLFIGLGKGTAPAAPKITSKTVVRQYADTAQAMYEDTLIGAEILQSAVTDLIRKSNNSNLLKARLAWLNARIFYQQTEGFRFGNEFVDEWEGQVNSWPLDEGLIDYVDSSYGTDSNDNPYYAANVILNPILKFGAKSINAKNITPELLSKELQEVDGVEANVATGYHAIEFLLWGQDLNGSGPGAGDRKYTDYSMSKCTHGNCDRRRAYLKAATELLVSDLKRVLNAWKASGKARKEVESDSKKGVSKIIQGLGSLSYGELAGERIKLGLFLHDPEEEQDCFSDNTHNSHYYNQVGIISIFRAHYVRADGSLISGHSLRDLVAQKDPELVKQIDDSMNLTMMRMQVMKNLADRRVMSYDQMLSEKNPEGNKVLQDIIDGLVAQTKMLEKIIPVPDTEEKKL